MFDDISLWMFVISTLVLYYLVYTYKPPEEVEERVRTKRRRKSAAYQRTGLFTALKMTEEEVTDFQSFRDHFKTFDEVGDAMKLAGLRTTKLVIGVDFTASNEWQGKKTFSRHNLHKVNTARPFQAYNPYQRVIQILGKTLQPFTETNTIYAYGFGDVKTQDYAVFPFKDDGTACKDFKDVLQKYNGVAKEVVLSGPTSYAPLIKKAIEHVRETKEYHILIIIADGQMEQESPTINAIVAASNYPLSIIMVGVGDGPWEIMEDFDDSLPARRFDNFQFVDFHRAMQNAQNPEAAFALQSLMEVPDQYSAIKKLGYLGCEPKNGVIPVAKASVANGNVCCGNESALKTSEDISFGFIKRVTAR